MKMQKGVLLLTLIGFVTLIHARYLHDEDEFDNLSSDDTSDEQLRAPVYKQGERSPEELADEFEGDIVLTDDQLSNGRFDPRFHWSGGRVPFVIENRFNDAEKRLIRSAMMEIESETCIKFVKRRREKDYIFIRTRPDSGCTSNIGNTGNKQIVNLQSPTDNPEKNCMSEGKGIIVHELLHTIGFGHMQSVSNRDRYETINFDNILLGRKHNFKWLQKDKYVMYGTPFDYKSIMHYGRKYFTSNGLDTITTTDHSFQDVIGQRTRLSSGDILRINKMYKC